MDDNAPLTVQEYKNLLLVQVADNGTIRAILSTLWKDAARDTADIQSQYLKALLKAIDIRLLWIPKERAGCKTTEEREALDKLTEALVGLQRNTKAALASDSQVESYVMGLIQATDFIKPAPGYLNPLDSAFMGDPTRPYPGYGGSNRG